MSSNRVQYFIRNILQNSKLNREKFVNNKKKYNLNKINHNLIVKRNFSSNSSGLPPPNNNNNNNFVFIVLAGISTYIITRKL